MKEREVKLFERGEQPRHANKLASLLSQQLFADPNENRIMYFIIDRSPMGTGKTIIQIWLSQKFGLPLLIITPNKIVKNNWKTECAEYGVPIVKVKTVDKNNKKKILDGIFTYNDLIGTSSAKGDSYIPASGLLERNLKTKIKGKGKLTKTKKQQADEIEVNPFSPTPVLIDILRKGCLVVFDEAQALKNPNLTAMAVQTIINTIYELRRYTEDSLVKNKVKEGMDEDEAREEAFEELKDIEDGEFENSRFALLSGTLFDKTPNLFTIFKVLRIITERNLINRNPRTGLSKLAGAQEIIDYAAGWDFEKTQLIVNKYGRRLYNKVDCEQAMFELYDAVIQPAISSAMPKIDIVDKRNLFVYLTIDEIKITNRGITLFKRSINYNVKTSSIEEGRQDIAGVGSGMAMVEVGLAHAFVRKAIELLEAYPTRKITIFYQYNASREIMLKGLEKYNPVVIAGLPTKGNKRILEEQRIKNIERFQEPNTNNRVAFVSYLIAKGFNLDDKFGGFPRVGLQMPTPRIIDQLQAASRIGRIDTVFDETDPQTVPRVYVIWPVNSDALLNIMDAAVDKSTILKVTTRTESGTAPKLPSDYPAEEEPQPKDEDLYPSKTSEVAKRLINQAENEIDALRQKGLSSKEIIREYIKTPENSDDESEGEFENESESESESEIGKTKSPRKKVPPKKNKKSIKSPKKESKSSEENEQE